MRQSVLKFWAGVAAGLLISLTGLAAYWFTPALASPDADGGRPAEAPLAVPVHVLVMGVDERDQVSGSRSDTMMLVRVDDRQVRVLSLPRDTLVDMGEHGEGKLNSAYTYGGADLAKQVTGELVGLDVDYYVKIDLSGFRQLIDLMGGVEFDVPRAMQYTDPTDGLVIDLQPGLQRLDGEKAEQFVRFRHDKLGDDMSRIHRQQEFLKAAVTQMLTPENLLKLPGLLSAARSYVDTDLPVTRQLRLGNAVFQARQNDAIVQETLPGHGDYVNGISFFLIDQQQRDHLVANWQGQP
jgi:polyisoprenyl-teichoic acid--peptidoglycan teichoic acid transferase